MPYAKEQVSNETEKRVLIGMIVSTDYLRDVAAIIKPKFFNIDYAKKVSQWVLDYYNKYKEAPGKGIEAIYQAQSEKLKQPEAEIIETFLQELSDTYLSEDKQAINQSWLKDETITFCKNRSLEILARTIEGHRISGDIRKAEETIHSFTKVAQQTSQWINPFQKEQIYQTFEEDTANRLFRLPGAIGDLMGWMQREWLVSIMAPTKVGKSFYAWEIAFHALTARLKVAIFSLEMNPTVYKKRIYKKMTAMAEMGGEYAYPVFDCKFNQDNTCQRAQRTNRIECPAIYTKDLSYKPCTACRESNTAGYYPETWWQTQYQKEDLMPEDVIKKVEGFKKLYGENLRLMCFPVFSAGFDDIIFALDNLEFTEGFVPDLILIDSFDITSPESSNELEDENIKWKKGKGLAATRHALVVNCNQANREAEGKDHIKRKHTGGSIKKLHHVDVEYILNQTDEEKDRNVMRMQVLIHRHDESTNKGETFVLQQLELGQPLLDSEWTTQRRDNKRTLRRRKQDE